MKAIDIIKKLDDIYSPSFAAGWDNTGLQCGETSCDVKGIYVALDCTGKVIDEALKKGCNMIVTHHPMIFSPIKSVTDRDIFGKRIIKLIKNNMLLFSLHTNYDILRMSLVNSSEMNVEPDTVLKAEGTDDNGEPYGFGFAGDLESRCTLRQFAEKLKKIYHLEKIRVYGDPDSFISRAAMCSGSGKGFLDDALRLGADVFITGDMDHHTAIDAVMKGISVIDGSHFGTEMCFVPDMANLIRSSFPEIIVVEDLTEQAYSII